MWATLYESHGGQADEYTKEIDTILATFNEHYTINIKPKLSGDADTLI